MNITTRWVSMLTRDWKNLVHQEFSNVAWEMMMLSKFCPFNIPITVCSHCSRPTDNRISCSRYQSLDPASVDEPFN